MARRAVTRYLWLGFGWLNVALAGAGAILPLLPTTPFLLVAAFAFARGSQRWHGWLINHRHFGPLISNWHAHRAISRRAKIGASASLLVLLPLSVLVGAPGWLLAVQAVVLGLVAVFLWSRPEPPECDR